MDELLNKIVIIVIGTVVAAISVWVKGLNTKVKDSAIDIALLKQHNVLKEASQSRDIKGRDKDADAVRTVLSEMNKKLDSMMVKFSDIEKALAQHGIVVP